MHGLGNDFVVVDAREQPFDIGAAETRAIADRRLGVGCDQLLVVQPATNGQADVFMRILNADGGEAEACGNGTRCVAQLVMAETGKQEAQIETKAGLLKAEAVGNGNIAVDMGPVALDWQDIPLAREMDTLNLGLEAGPLSDPVGVNVGNPHAVFFVEDADGVPLEEIGPGIETDALFPERTNVGAAQVLDGGNIRLRVWERGAGVTQACGSGACAALVAAHRRELTGRSADVILDGGRLAIEWRDDNHVVMTGPVATSFTGVLDPALRTLAEGGA
ncbi:MAG: diaminopimelate epimerase [Rhodospirillales bacterium]